METLLRVYRTHTLRGALELLEIDAVDLAAAGWRLANQTWVETRPRFLRPHVLVARALPGGVLAAVFVRPRRAAAPLHPALHGIF
jgi:hypothetical protein